MGGKRGTIMTWHHHYDTEIYFIYLFFTLWWKFYLVIAHPNWSVCCRVVTGMHPNSVTVNMNFPGETDMKISELIKQHTIRKQQWQIEPLCPLIPPWGISAIQVLTSSPSRGPEELPSTTWPSRDEPSGIPIGWNSAFNGLFLHVRLCVKISYMTPWGMRVEGWDWLLLILMHLTKSKNKMSNIISLEDSFYIKTVTDYRKMHTVLRNWAVMTFVTLWCHRGAVAGVGPSSAQSPPT